MQIKYAIRNLRVIKSSPFIELKPLTIVVGRNSGGKSTFVRTFPLLKQSIETRSSAPVLWWGDDVDFGDFKTSVHNRDLASEISFHFKVKNEGVGRRISSEAWDDEVNLWNAPSAVKRDIAGSEYKLSIFVGADGERTVRRRVEIDVRRRAKLLVEFDSTGRTSKDVFVEGTRISELLDGFAFFFPESNLFSRPMPVRKLRDEGRTLRRGINLQQAVTQEIASAVRPLIDPRTATETILAHAQMLLSLPSMDRSALEALCDRTTKVTFKKLFRKFAASAEDPSLRRIRSLGQLYYTFLSLSIASERLREVFASTSYLKPVRVRGERFTRAQELEISEVSPDGSNLPIFLASLNKEERADFSSWVNGLFGYGVDVSTGGGQISIVLVKDGFNVSLADTGYGISQILPFWRKLGGPSTQADVRVCAGTTTFCRSRSSWSSLNCTFILPIRQSWLTFS